MDQLITSWIALAAGAVCVGVSLASVLAAPRRFEALFALGGLVGAAIALAAARVVVETLDRIDAALYAVAFLFGFGGGGYALASSVMLSGVKPPPAPTVNPSKPAVSRPCVILCRCIEPESYAFSATASMLSRLIDEGLVEPSVGTLPLLFLAQKARYRLAGGTSPGLRELRALAERVRSSLRELDPDVGWATCAGEQRLAVRVARALGSGYRRIVVAELSVSPQTHFERAQHEARDVADLFPDSHISFITAIPSDDTVVRILADRILAAMSASTRRTGVVVAAQGQPEQRTANDPTFVEREMTFVNRLKLLLVERGLDPESVRVVWTDWGEPDVTSGLRHLAALGYERLLVCPATRPVDSLATRSDLPAAVHAARLDLDEAEVVVMPAWGADPALAAAIAAHVRKTLDEDESG